ncbi:MAG: flagellar filament capping protein FliD, partial [Planctomycetota bacterium]
NTLNTRIASNSETQIAYTELSTRLSTLKNSASELRKPSSFEQTRVSSSNEDVIRATSQRGAAVGSYTFQVARLTQTRQLVSRGYETADASPIGAGNISLELGDARLQTEALLDDLNGGEGVRRGVVELVDRLGRIATVDLSDAVTLDDVVSRFNAAGGVGITASTDGQRITLNDRTNGTGNLVVRDLTGAAAEDLGLNADTATNTIEGKGLVELSSRTPLADLNSGGGVATGADDGLRVTLGDGTSFDVSTTGATSLNDVIQRFNDAAGGKATLNVDGNRLQVADLTWPANAKPFSVEGLNGSTTAADLGIDGETNGLTLDGRALLARAGSVLLGSLRGGQGLDVGVITVTNSNNVTRSIDLSSVGDVATLIETVNESGAGVEARLNAAGNGIDLFDVAGGGGNLVVADANRGVLAEQLGWAGEFEGDDRSLRASGNDLERAWFNGGTRLSDLNGGSGVSLGEIQVTDSAGNVADIDFGRGTFNDVQDILDDLNREFASAGVQVTARINDNGDGLLLTDEAGGAGSLQIEDVDGSTAADLRIAGEFEDGVADGTYEQIIEVTADDTLQDVRNKINDLGFAARAEVLNSGGTNPFRLSISGRESGRLGMFVLDTRLEDGSVNPGMESRVMSEARDAAVFFGGASDGQSSPLLITSSTNLLTDVVPGLELELAQISDNPVTISVEQDLGATLEDVQKFVDGFNELNTSIAERTRFNSETGERGALLGEPIVQRVQSDIFRLLNRQIETGNNRYRILSDIGIRLGEGGVLEFNQDKFNEAWADDSDAVARMFSATDIGFGFQLKDVVDRFTDPVD